MRRKLLGVILSLAMLLSLAICPQAGAATVYPLTIENYGNEWIPLSRDFEASPQRVVSNTQQLTELLLQLGLEDIIVGTAADYGTVAPEVAEAYANLTMLSSDYVSKELVLSVEPDIVMGRGDLFADAEWGCGLVEDLHALGIKTYLQNTSKPDATIEDMYRDIIEIGQIFDVQDRADAYASDQRQRFQSLTEGLPDASEAKTFVILAGYDGNAISLYGGESQAFMNDALSYIKLENAFDELALGVGVEMLIDINPDVILYSHWGDQNTEEQIAELCENKAIQTVPAIRDRQVFVMDSNEFTYGYKIIEGVEKLATQIYPDL